MWDLHVCGCDERCWADKKNMTVHRLRLEIAEHMDIPLHEVHELDVSFKSGSRPGEPSVARMHIRITSPRHTQETGTLMLRSLFYNMERSSEVLAMLVLGSREISTQNLGFLHKQKKSEDVYMPYYHDLVVITDATPNVEPTVESANVEVPNVEGPENSSIASQVALACAVSAGVIALVLKCVFSQYGKVREHTLQRLGEPLASPEDPPLFPGDHVTRLVMPLDNPRDIVQQSTVERYLVAVYARALC